MRILKKMASFAAVCALVTPTPALAAQPAGLSPLVSLSMVASPQSQAALCAVGSAGAASAAAATSAQPTPGQGCVLPVPEAAVAPLPQQASAASTGFSPLLIGLGAIGLGILLFALLHDDEDRAPPQPVSPA